MINILFFEGICYQSDVDKPCLVLLDKDLLRDLELSTEALILPVELQNDFAVLSESQVLPRDLHLKFFVKILKVLYLFLKVGYLIIGEQNGY